MSASKPVLLRLPSSDHGLGRNSRCHNIIHAFEETAVQSISGRSIPKELSGEHLDLSPQGGLSPAEARREPRGVIAAFARHETFHPRYGWIKKGFDAAERNPDVFVRDDAGVMLGVGKNMVRAIRYWCHAMKVLEQDPRARDAGSVPTAFGRQLFGRTGFDPYMENLGSLWLLHWQLLAPPCTATAWHLAFNMFVRQEFTLDELNAALADYVAREFPTARLAPSSLKKDVSCIARMYAEAPTTAAVGEDSIQCPFAELGLLRPTGPKTFAFNLGSKPGLTCWLVAAAALQFAARSDSNASTVSISTLLHAPGSPGLAFKLTEAALYAALEEAAGADSALAVTDAAGLIQLSFTEQPQSIAARLVRRHFRTSRARRAFA